jgi:immunity repressor protein (phage-related protein)
MDTANMKAIELHERTGISKASISEYLSGNYEPKQRNIFKIAQALNVSPSYLMGVNDDPRPPVQSPATASDDLPALTQRDERQIAKDLEDMLHSLKGSAAMGELEDEEDMELLKASLLQAMTLSKRIAKKKFTPKKYRK